MTCALPLATARTARDLTPELRHLVERALGWNDAALANHTSEGPSPEAHRLLARWKRLASLRSGTEAAFTDRLAHLGWTEPDALAALSPQTLPDDFPPPDWALLLDEVFASTSLAENPAWDEAQTLAAAGAARYREDFSAAEDDRPIFLALLAPFLQWALNEIRTEPAFARNFSPTAQEDLAFSLLRKLSWTSARTVAHELKRARARGELWAATPEERYDLYINAILPAQRETLFQRYPVLARLLAVLTLQFARNTQTVARRLDRDHHQIADLLGSRTRLRVLRAAPFLSDDHNGGQSVWRLTFGAADHSSRNPVVFYKPRSLAVDHAWAGLLDWLNRQGLQPALEVPPSLDRGGYGWAVAAYAADCSNEAELSEYFLRQGIHTALIAALGGQDFHAENFIASGAMPVPIDLEGLLAPTVSAMVGELSALPPLLRPLNATGACNLMLPYFRAGEPGHPLYSASGVGGTGNRVWPRKLPRWTGKNTDLLQLEIAHQDFRFEESLPTFDGKKITADAFHAHIAEGIELTFRFLAAHKDALLAEDSPLAPFRGLSSRTLFRDTQEYTDLMFWTTAPDILESGAAYEVALEVLAGAVPFFSNGERFPGLIDKEKEAFWQRDVPLATTPNTATAIELPDGTSFGPVLPMSAWEQLQLRIADWTPGHAAWQASVASALLAMTQPIALSREDNLLAIATKIGDALAATAVRDGEILSWINFAHAQGSDRVVPLPVNPWDLNGNAGNAIFLADLARLTGENRFAQLARQALSSAHCLLNAMRQTAFGSAIGVSAFTGSFGLVYGFLRAGIALRDEPLIDSALACALAHPLQRFEQETNPDFLTGVAGTLAVLGALAHCRPHPQLREQADLCARIIVSAARNNGRDGWQVPFFPRPLLGIAHGSSGIASGLLLSSALRETSAASDVLAAFAHERRHFAADVCRWPNLQRDDRHYMTGWCAGPAGIGLARLLALRSHDPVLLAERASLEADLEDAIRAAQQCLHAGDHHACCGDAGSIVFLAAAARQCARPDLLEASSSATGKIVAHFREHTAWRMQGITDSMPLSGLLSGLPGIGLTFLSVLDPACTEFLTLC